MKTREGNLIDMALSGEFDVIVHGCNCDIVMGGGIAYQIRNRIPEAWKADKATSSVDPDAKLGTVSIAKVGDLTVINGYTQRHPHPPVSYEALQSVFEYIARTFPKGTRIGYPMIGAGLAGGDWSRISVIIDQALEGHDHTLVIYVP